METLNIDKEKAINAYKQGSEEQKKVLEQLFGKETFRPKMVTDRIKTFNDDDYLSPFDFTIDEVGKDVSECITDFDSARKALGLTPNDDVKALRMVKRTPKTQTDLTCINQFVNEFNPEQIEALIALNKLFTIARAWNMEDGFVPCSSDWNQDKWFPWFKYDEDAAEFVCARTGNIAVVVGNRLCFKSRERSEQFGRQFADLYNKVLI